MAAVVEFVEDVGDAIGNVIEAVGDVVESVGNFIVDAVETVATVVENVIKDPVPTLLAIGGQMIGIPYPVTMGVVTAARGGDIEDIVLSMGTAYVAPMIAGPIAGSISSTLVDAGVNAAVSNALGSSISSGLINGTIAEVKGGDFEKGFAGGFTGGMINAGVGEVASYVKPSVMEFAQESGIDLQTAGDVFKAGTRAVGAGISAEVRGGDFATAFTNSAIGSGVDAGTRSINRSIDEQFKTAVTQWDEKEPESKPIELNTDGAGIPTSLKDEVPISQLGFDSRNDVSNQAVLADNQQTLPPVVSDLEILPSAAPRNEAAPVAQTTSDFANMAVSPEDNEPDIASYFPQSVSDVAAKAVPEVTPEVISATVPETSPEVKPEGALTTIAAQQETPVEPAAPVSPIVETPVATNLVTTGIAPEAPVGGLNAVAPKSQEDKMAESQGLKVTDFTRPMVTSVGNLLKSNLMQTKKPTARPAPPAGALAMMNRPKVAPTKAAPPRIMDVSKLIPIQRAAQPTSSPLAQQAAGPVKFLPSTAKLSPIRNIAGLSSMLRKTA
jgi:hypothetical protein